MGDGFKNFIASITSLLVKIPKPLLIAVAVVTAALIALKAAMAAFDEYSNKQRKNLEQQQSSVTGLSNSITALTASYDSLKSSWSDYTSAKEALDSMTRGTKE